MVDIRDILRQHACSDFNLDVDTAAITLIGNGHINKTYKVDFGRKAFVLQQINTKVFPSPEVIADNLESVRLHLAVHHREYVFINPIHARNRKTLVFDSEGNPWRLYKYIEGTYTIEEAQTIEQAREAATAFARFAKNLKSFDLSRIHPTIERFHDLALRYDQFTSALSQSTDELKQSAHQEIEFAKKNHDLVDRYQSVIRSGILKPGVFHNDTKINNVLFDRDTKKSVAVIDLDTVMEGYFIYDLGDLVRTVVSPVSEEEKDLSRITVRREFYDAVVSGYMTELGDSVSEEERSLADFAGPMMTYIMALRFLADHLRGNTYYHVSYPEQNLVRAKNQLNLLEKLKDLRN